MLGASYEFLPGDTAYVSFNVVQFAVAGKDKVHLSWGIEPVDAGGVKLVPPASGKIEETLAAEDKDWSPKVRHSFLIPPFLESGTYRIRLTVKDETSGGAAEQDIPFRVRGASIAPSDTLVGRNFRFLKSEDGTVEVTSYKPGDTLWARFEITGFKLGLKNRYEVEYGLAVQDGEGQVVFTEPKAAEEQNESFYPRRHMPGMLSLTLQNDVAKGSYAIVVTVLDRVGMQKFESTHPFRIE